MKALVKALRAAFVPTIVPVSGCHACADAALPRVFGDTPAERKRIAFMDANKVPDGVVWTADEFLDGRGSDEFGVNDREVSAFLAAWVAYRDLPRVDVSGFVDAPLTLKVSALAESDSGNHYSEKEHFVADYLLQKGADILDDDCKVFGLTLAMVVQLLKDYQAPQFFTAGVESAAILKWRTDYNEMARKWADGQRKIAELEESLDQETSRADNAGRNASAFEDRMGNLQVENGRQRDKLGEEVKRSDRFSAKCDRLEEELDGLSRDFALARGGDEALAVKLRQQQIVATGLRKTVERVTRQRDDLLVVNRKIYARMKRAQGK